MGAQHPDHSLHRLQPVATRGKPCSSCRITPSRWLNTRLGDSFRDFVPDMLVRVQLRRIGWQRRQPQMIRNRQVFGLVRTGPVQHHRDKLWQVGSAPRPYFSDPGSRMDFFVGLSDDFGVRSVDVVRSKVWRSAPGVCKEITPPRIPFPPGGWIAYAFIIRSPQDGGHHSLMGLANAE